MPYAPKKPCLKPYCPELTDKGYCEKHKSPRFRSKNYNEKSRPSARQRGYTNKWEKARKGYLAAHPICADPFNKHGGRPTAASVVDHIEPHRGDMNLFWDFENNVQALCRSCHSMKTARGH